MPIPRRIVRRRIRLSRRQIAARPGRVANAPGSHGIRLSSQETGSDEGEQLLAFEPGILVGNDRVGWAHASSCELSAQSISRLGVHEPNDRSSNGGAMAESATRRLHRGLDPAPIPSPHGPTGFRAARNLDRRTPHLGTRRGGSRRQSVSPSTRCWSHTRDDCERASPLSHHGLGESRRRNATRRDAALLPSEISTAALALRRGSKHDHPDGERDGEHGGHKRCCELIL